MFALLLRWVMMIVMMCLLLIYAARVAAMRSPAGHILAYANDTSELSQIHFVDLARCTHVSTVIPMKPTALRWSPDGTRIAAAADDGDIWVMNWDGSNPRRLTEHPLRDFAPSWMPDSRNLAFTSNRRYNNDLYVIDVETGAFDSILISADADETQIDFDPTDPFATRAIFTRAPNDGSPTQIHLLNRLTGETRPIRADFFYNFAPDWSPDGSRLIYLTSDYATLVNMLVIEPDYVTENAAPQTLLFDQARAFTYAQWISDNEIVIASGGFAATPMRFSRLVLPADVNDAPIVEPIPCAPSDAVYFSIHPRAFARR